jgi:hypothetical protein
LRPNERAATEPTAQNSRNRRFVPDFLAVVQFDVVAASLPRHMVRRLTDKAAATSSCTTTDFFAPSSPEGNNII